MGTTNLGIDSQVQHDSQFHLRLFVPLCERRDTARHLLLQWGAVQYRMPRFNGRIDVMFTIPATASGKRQESHAVSHALCGRPNTA